MKRADIEAKRAENLIKHKQEIMNKPKKYWNVNSKQKLDIKKKSKEELKSIHNKYE